MFIFLNPPIYSRIGAHGAVHVRGAAGLRRVGAVHRGLREVPDARSRGRSVLVHLVVSRGLL